MDKPDQNEVSKKRRGVSKPMIGAVFGIVAIGLVTTQFVQAKSDDENSDAMASSTSEMCSTASLMSKPNPRQTLCLMEVQAEYGTADCQSSNGFDMRLRADVAQCEAKIRACLDDTSADNNVALKFEANAPVKPAPKPLFVVKREPAKLSELGRAQPASETKSYFVQCDNKAYIAE